jgi:hypothetical protein
MSPVSVKLPRPSRSPRPCTNSEIGRAAFKQMTGLSERVATDLVSSLLKNGYLASDSAYGALRFAIPRSALRFYFPELWPEAEAE